MALGATPSPASILGIDTLPIHALRSIHTDNRRLDLKEAESGQTWLHDLMRFMKHFPLRTQDVSLTVLKGHLLTEELLREFINDKVKHPSHVRDAGLRYIQCVHVARAFSLNPEDWVWDALVRLNAIRNKLSHALEPDGLDDAVSSLLQLVRHHDPREIPDELRGLFTPLGMAVFSMHAALSAQLRLRVSGTLATSLKIPRIDDKTS